MFKIDFIGKTDVGRRREQNEDMFFISAENNFCVLADGMGGHQAGEVASRLAVNTITDDFVAGIDTLSHYPPDTAEPEFLTLILKSMSNANKIIYEQGKNNPNYRQMGTTVVVFALAGSDAILAHVGDSRIYLIRDDNIIQETEDHSFIYEQLKERLITPEEAKHSFFRSMVTRALGVKEKVQIDIGTLKVKQGDIFLLCSDGLSDFVEDSEIKSVVKEHDGDIDAGCQALVDLANSKGGHDNITIIMGKVVTK